MKKIILLILSFLFISSSYALESLDLREINVVLNEIKRFQKKQLILSQNQNLSNREKKREQRKIQSKILFYNKNLINIISQDQIFEERQTEKINIDLWGQLQELLKPVLSSLQKISKRPRKIEKLKDSIEESKERLDKIEKSSNKISDKSISENYPEPVSYTHLTLPTTPYV